MKNFLLSAMFLILFIFCGTTFAANSPEDVYRKYIDALKNGEFSEMINYISTEGRKNISGYTGEQKMKMFKHLQEMAPISYKVVKKTIPGAYAYLWIEGLYVFKEDPKPQKGYAKVYFINESGEWKIQKEMCGKNPQQ